MTNQLNFNEFSNNSEALEAQLNLYIQRKELTKAIELLERLKIKPEKAIKILPTMKGGRDE